MQLQMIDAMDLLKDDDIKEAKEALEEAIEDRKNQREENEQMLKELMRCKYKSDKYYKKKV